MQSEGAEEVVPGQSWCALRLEPRSFFGLSAGLPLLAPGFREEKPQRQLQISGFNASRGKSTHLVGHVDVPSLIGSGLAIREASLGRVVHKRFL